ncbi:MAG: hypothetical protein COW03_02485 [Cytophagales bacterium CG12_big_fil_rev_8_21_14_0_65_40_12]|nr:MAG: hypothetical protein COW03_02485 [Cytophagales bacterium CG12_big_fil_rev_8_21_14_0_65_40_12]PIW03412.1 MAG: hypothetical protein COW40_14730 [Cytophagales bacterium CG17_big_fil_post_rev_8_21_14_2_50_40_13]
MCLVKHVTHSQTKSTVGNAQWNVGLNGTVNLNQFNFSGLVTGGEINGFIARVLNDNFSLQAELGVKQLGGNRRDAAQEFEGGNVDQILYFNRRAVINSFNSNLILNIHPRTELGSVSMTLFFGVSHALKVEVSEVQDQFYFFNDGSSIYVSEVRQNTSRFYENSIFSGLMGLSVAVPFGKKTMDFQMRYEQGINQLNRVKFSIPQYAGKLRTNSLKIGLSYQLFNF